jgi:2-polyprenyl-6-hydroxyphenyl methylase/3-demethylubiquinone-9 3-methyltransferase
VHDWLGGYPYESIARDECIELLARIGFKVEREFIQDVRFPHGVLGSGCDEYVFRRLAGEGERNRLPAGT